MTIKAYPDYRDSGIPFLGDIPSGWKSVPLWTLFRRTKRTSFENEELLSVYRDHGVVVKSSRDDNNNNAAEDLSTYQLVNPGDLAINKMKAWQGSVAISDHRGIVSPAYFVFESLHAENDRYFHYLLRSSPFIAAYARASKGIRPNQWDLDPQQHSRLPVLIPPEPEQRQIADYLDAQTAKIDALIRKQERLIEMLAERRQAVISHAVTRGLDVEAPASDVSSDFLGKVPRHWKVWPLKWLISGIAQGVSPLASAELADDISWGVLKSGCVNHGVFSELQHKRLPAGFTFDPSIEVRVGDLLVSRASGSPSLVGSAAIVRALHYRLILSDKIFRLLVSPDHDPEFLEWFMNSRPFREQVAGAISGAEGLANNLPSSSLRRFAFPVPPLHEQHAIVEFLRHEAAKIDALASKAREMIEVLKERRQSLIGAAVAGKIDVRGLV